MIKNFTEQYNTGIAPAFVVPIKPKAAKPKQTVELRCVVSGIPTPTVVWCRGDEQIVPDDSHVISYLPETGESKLTICNATELDVDNYTVQAVNTNGVAKCKANLIIGNFILRDEIFFRKVLKFLVEKVIVENIFKVYLVLFFFHKNSHQINTLLLLE